MKWGGPKLLSEKLKNLNFRFWRKRKIIDMVVEQELAFNKEQQSNQRYIHLLEKSNGAFQELVRLLPNVKSINVLYEYQHEDIFSITKCQATVWTGTTMEIELKLRVRM